MSDRQDLYQKVVAAVDGDGVIAMAQSVLRVKTLPGEEKPVADVLMEGMNAAGLDAEMQTVPADALMEHDSVNVIGIRKGRGDGYSLMYNGHMDTNPVCEGWTRDPFGAAVEDGWLYGLIHMNVNNVCFIKACEAVRKAGIELKGDLIVTNVCGELRGGAGTKHAIKSGLRADYFINGEPTDLDMCIAHTASVVFNIHVIGRMKHFSTAQVAGQKGVNAVEKMTRVIQALGTSHTPLPGKAAGGWLEFEPHPDLPGLPQLNIGPIRGGLSRQYNTTRPALLPDFCSLTVDIRLVPGMSKETVVRDVTALLESMQAQDPDLKFEIETTPDTFPHTFSAPRDSAVVQAVRAAHRHVLGLDAEFSRSFTYAASDASWLSHAGIPGVIYGPSGRYLSRPDERVETAELINATKVYACLIADFCTRTRSNHEA